jgi:hypothetical protein
VSALHDEIARLVHDRAYCDDDHEDADYTARMIVAMVRELVRQVVSDGLDPCGGFVPDQDDLLNVARELGIELCPCGFRVDCINCETGYYANYAERVANGSL